MVIDPVVCKARNGNKSALDELIKSIQDKIYGYSLQMLGFPEDAEDATQEILIRIITNLGNFRGESSFNTWALRIASNYLLTTRKSLAEKMGLDFNFAESLIYKGPDHTDLNFSEAEMGILKKEVRISCLHALLICLKRENRIVLILGELFEVSSEEGAHILDITPDVFRKRLSRSRKKIYGFMEKNCGLIRKNNPCACAKQVKDGLKKGYVNKDALQFASRKELKDNSYILKCLSEVNEIEKALTVYRSIPEYAAPGSIVGIIREMIDSNKYDLLFY